MNCSWVRGRGVETPSLYPRRTGITRHVSNLIDAEVAADCAEHFAADGQSFENTRLSYATPAPAAVVNP